MAAGDGEAAAGVVMVEIDDTKHKAQHIQFYDCPHGGPCACAQDLVVLLGGEKLRREAAQQAAWGVPEAALPPAELDPDTYTFHCAGCHRPMTVGSDMAVQHARLSGVEGSDEDPVVAFVTCDVCDHDIDRDLSSSVAAQWMHVYTDALALVCGGAAAAGMSGGAKKPGKKAKKKKGNKKAAK